MPGLVVLEGTMHTVFIFYFFCVQIFKSLFHFHLIVSGLFTMPDTSHLAVHSIWGKKKPSCGRNILVDTFPWCACAGLLSTVSRQHATLITCPVPESPLSPMPFVILNPDITRNSTTVLGLPWASPKDNSSGAWESETTSGLQTLEMSFTLDLERNYIRASECIARMETWGESLVEARWRESQELEADGARE